MAFSGYIDIHTHNKVVAGYTNIRSLYSEFEVAQSGILCSIGLHPWYVNSGTLDSELKQLQKYIGLSNVLAIGECGLDKVCETDWDLQIQAFRIQIELAKSINKPLIIHCVRAYEEVLKLLNDTKVIAPLIFHGFTKKWQLAEQILKEGYYISFGASLLDENTNITEVLTHTPADKFFLETDNSGADIKDIYLAAAAIRKTPLDTLILQLQKNFETVFKR